MTNSYALAREVSILLVVADEQSRSNDLTAALQAAGWEVRVAESGATARLSEAEPVSLFLLNLAQTETDGAQIARSIRATPGPSGSAPILALCSSKPAQIGPYPTNLDAVLVTSDGMESLIQTLESWRPVPLDPTRRIAAMFGAGPIAGMIERLARRLEAAISNLDLGVIDKAEAHHLAGLCGTLGFGQAHATWLDLSLGDDAVLADVRRTTRLTLSAIARGI